MIRGVPAGNIFKEHSSTILLSEHRWAASGVYYYGWSLSTV